MKQCLFKITSIGVNFEAENQTSDLVWDWFGC